MGGVVKEKKTVVCQQCGREFQAKHKRQFCDGKCKEEASPQNRIKKRDGYACIYCGDTNRSDFVIDHIVPASKGGKATASNLVTACWTCNAKKKDKLLDGDLAEQIKSEVARRNDDAGIRHDYLFEFAARHERKIRAEERKRAYEAGRADALDVQIRTILELEEDIPKLISFRDEIVESSATFERHGSPSNVGSVLYATDRCIKALNRSIKIKIKHLESTKVFVGID